jgi:hypothetical protein
MILKRHPNGTLLFSTDESELPFSLLQDAETTLITNATMKIRETAILDLWSFAREQVQFSPIIIQLQFSPHMGRTSRWHRFVFPSMYSLLSQVPSCSPYKERSLAWNRIIIFALTYTSQVTGPSSHQRRSLEWHQIICALTFRPRQRAAELPSHRDRSVFAKSGISPERPRMIFPTTRTM